LTWARLNIAAIDATLAAIASSPRELIDAARSDEPLTADALRRLGEGYRYVDELLASRTEIFQYGQTRHILEINHRVLCGTTPERRLQFADHIAETERWFYERPGAGISGLFGWLQRHRSQAPLQLAAGVFVQVLSYPQLFIEGNSRSATLLASYLLARSGLPPLVVTPEFFPRYSQQVDRCEAFDRNGFASVVGRGPTSAVAGLFKDAADAEFLLRVSSPASAGA